MSVIVYQFQTVKFIQMMSLTFGLFTQVSGSGPLGPLVLNLPLCEFSKGLKNEFETAVVNESAVLEPLKFYCIFFS